MRSDLKDLKGQEIGYKIKFDKINREDKQIMDK